MVSSPNLLFPSGNKDRRLNLADVGVVADDDEHWRRDAACAGSVFFSHEAVILLVVAVETEQRTLQFDRKLRFAPQLMGFATLSR